MLDVRFRAVAALTAIVIVAFVAAAALLSPPVRRVRAESRRQQAQQDVQTITRALIRFYEDNGFFPLWDRAPGGSPNELRRVDLLVGPGAAASAPADSEWVTGAAGSLGDELISNAPSYRVRGGPDEEGWAGPYLPADFGTDPWNHRYVVNIGLIPGDDSPDADQTKFAVWVLSAGPNGVIDTPYKQPLASAGLGGDDIGARVQ